LLSTGDYEGALREFEWVLGRLPSDPANAATKAARERLMTAGFTDVTLLSGAPQAVAA